MLEARPGPAQPVTAALECAWPPLPPSREAGSYMGAKLSLGSGVAEVAYPPHEPVVSPSMTSSQSMTIRARRVSTAREG